MDGAMQLVRQLVGRLANRLNTILPPERRDAVKTKLQAFAYAYPKLAMFLLINVLLTGIPLLCFCGFVVTVFASSLITALLGAIVITLLTTAFMAFVASLFLLPLVFFTTLGAFFLFLWGLAAYYLFVYLQDTGVAPSDDVIDGKFNTWSGGRFRWSARNAKRATTANKRPRVEGKDSAVGLEEEPIKQIEQIAPDAQNESDQEELTMSIGSQITVIDHQSTIPGPLQENAALTGAGLPITYVQLRNEHPDGLRLDRKGLFKVDDIASDSSLEDTKERMKSLQKTVKARSGNASTMQSTPQTAVRSSTDIPKMSSIDSNTSTRATEVAVNANVEDNDQSEPSSGKSSAEIARLMATANDIEFSALRTRLTCNAEDRDQSEPSSGKSSAEIERLMAETTSADEIDFSEMKSGKEEEKE